MKDEAEKHNDIWPVVHVNNWTKFEEAVSSKLYREWIFRGHSNLEWKLESSFYRLFIDMQAIFKAARARSTIFKKDEHEKALLEQFKSNAHLYLSTLPKRNNNLEWFSLMQHYGTPTRMLDFTFSPYVAAYFAFESGHGDCCIYAIKPSHFTDTDREHFKDPNYKDKLFDDQREDKSFFIAYEPDLKNERIVAQQGLFIVSSTNYETYDTIINQYNFRDSEGVVYILSHKMRYEGIKKLRLMNITAATLFPGIDGFCRSLKYQVLESHLRLRRYC